MFSQESYHPVSLRRESFHMAKNQRMDFTILINWMSPLTFKGASGVIFHFYFIFR